MSKRMMQAYPTERPELERLIKESVEAVKNMTPEQRDATHQAQAQSWARSCVSSLWDQIYDLKKQLASANAEIERLRAALAIVRDEGMLGSHSSHWDSQGTHGRNCPACRANFKALDAVRAALTTPQPDAGAQEDRVDIKNAARSLKDNIGSHGFVGAGVDTIYVYIKCSRNHWRGELYATWQGYPVEWQFDVGPAIAGSASSPSPEAAPPNADDVAHTREAALIESLALETPNKQLGYTMAEVAMLFRAERGAARQAGECAGREFAAEYLQNAIDDPTTEITEDLIQAIVDDIRRLAPDTK